MRELVKLEGLTRQQWLEYRRSGIGSSDAAIIMGASKWKSPLALYLEKRGEIKEPDIEEIEYVEWGVRLEEPIAQAYAEKTGRVVTKCAAIYQHDKVDWLLANPDRFIEAWDDTHLPPAVGRGCYEGKTATIFKREDWEGEPPLAYQIQGQHQMAVTGLAWASFGVLIGGNRFRWCDVVRNDRFIKAMVAKEKEFMERVLNGDPPMAGSSEADTRALALLHPAEMHDKAIALPVESLEWHMKREEGAAMIKEGEALKREADNNLKQLMGDAEYGVVPGGNGRYKWSLQHKKEFFVPASSTRVFRHVR